MTNTRSAEEDVFAAESPEEAGWESYLWGEDWSADAAFVKFIVDGGVDDAVHDDDDYSDFDDDDDKYEGDDDGAVHSDDDEDSNEECVQVKRLLLCLGRSDRAPVQAGQCHLS